MTLTTPEPTPKSAEPAARSAFSGTPVRGFVPFPPDRVRAYRAAGLWTGNRLDSVLRRAASAWPGRTAVLDSRSAHSFAELDHLADRASAGFAALGIVAGDRVLLQLPNSTGFAIVLFGLLRAGAIPVLCLPGHRLAEMTDFAGLSDAVAVVVADEAGGFDYRAMATQLVVDHVSVRQVVVDGGTDAERPHSPGSQTCSPPRGSRQDTTSTRRRLRYCWFRAAPRARPNSFPARTRTIGTTSPRARTFAV